MTLQEFYDQCERHDWYYDYSDDNRVWEAGLASLGSLQAAAKESPAHQALLDAFNAHQFTGKPWGNEKAPKPERP